MASPCGFTVLLHNGANSVNSVPSWSLMFWINIVDIWKWMALCRITRHLFTIWCIHSAMLAGSATEQSSKSVQYNAQQGVRYTGGVFADVPARSLLHCAVECSIEESCSSFNYRAGRCELLSAMVSGLTTVEGWTHGYDNTPGNSSLVKVLVP